MKYPIDVEKYIAAMKVGFGPNKAAEEAHREIIPEVNACYEDGRRGKSNYPMDVSAEIRAFKEAVGHEPSAIVANFINWCNEAYEQGRLDAGRAVGA